MKASGGQALPEIVKKYSHSLQTDLKSNSLTDIKKLTNIAREEVKYCKQIAKVISTRIKTASPDEKLPSLYLLDSIIKNIGGEYINEFCCGISDLFFYSFKVQIDLSIQLKYLKLLKTWVTVFGEQTIHGIEERIMKVPHYGPKQFEYGKIKEKYNQHLIFVNPNKFCKSSNDFSQLWRQPEYTQSVPNLDWLNKILKTSISDQDTGTQKEQSREEISEITKNSLVHSLYRHSQPQTVIELHDGEKQPSRSWFCSEVAWVRTGYGNQKETKSLKRERSLFEEDRA